MPDISVIIPVYNRSDELRMVLDSLCRQTLAAERFEVIIADDGSAEDIQAVLKEYPKLQLKYARQPDEGFRVSAARNLGTDQASGRIIVYNDNGVILKSDVLEKHIAYHQKNDDAFVVLGYIFGMAWKADEDKMRHILENNNPDRAIELMKAEGGMGDGRDRYIEWNGEVEGWYLPWVALWGGHISVDAEFIKKHGIRWNEGFTSWGGEDNEYGLQLCKAGARLSLCRDVEVVHYPTIDKRMDADDADFQANHKKMRQYILSLHPGRDVEAYAELGGGANSHELRTKFFQERGWEPPEVPVPPEGQVPSKRPVPAK